jgi:hypothetical protein
LKLGYEGSINPSCLLLCVMRLGNHALVIFVTCS